MSINLSGLSTAKQAQKRRDRMFSYSILFAFLMLIIVSGIYVGLMAYNKTLEIDIADKKKATDMELTKLSGKDTVRVVNIAHRIDDIGKNYTASSLPFGLIERINTLMLDDIALDGYRYEIDKDVVTVELNITSQDFLAVARQVAKFKQSEDFMSVSVQEINRDNEDNTVNFVIKLTIESISVVQIDIPLQQIQNAQNAQNAQDDAVTAPITTYDGLETQENWNPIPE